MIRLLLFSAFLVALAGCKPSDPGASAGARTGRLQIVTTTSLIGDLARQIGGPDVDVQSLMGPGVDPHLYRARESDVQRMVSADLILYTGLHLEGKMGEVLEGVARRGIGVEPVAETIGEDALIAATGSMATAGGTYDPHVWMDVTLWRRVAVAVADALAAADPAHEAAFRARSLAYDARLDSLDAYVRGRVAEIPPERRVLVTAHDAFGYFGKAYGVDVRGLQGISTATEAGTADVRALADFVAETRLPALFVESSVSPRAIEAVRAAVRARGFEVRIGGSLYSDALGGPDSGADTYVGMIRANVDTVVDGLNGTARGPARGTPAEAPASAAR